VNANGEFGPLIERLRARVAKRRTLTDDPALTRACLDAIEALTSPPAPRRARATGSAASLPPHLSRAWDVAAQIIWLALDEDDRAYDIAADVVTALDGLYLNGRSESHNGRSEP
jgi:hypothetical protein